MQNEIEEMARIQCEQCIKHTGSCDYDNPHIDNKECLSLRKRYAEALYNAGYRKEKTCKNVTENRPVDEFICSECGLILQDYCKKRLDEDGDEYFFEFEIKYCPCCGAKVVEE